MEVPLKVGDWAIIEDPEKSLGFEDACNVGVPLRISGEDERYYLVEDMESRNTIKYFKRRFRKLTKLEKALK